MLDFDGDGFTVISGDCNDRDSDVYPGAEDLPNDGIDQDCNGADVDACDNVACGEHGQCVAVASNATCVCDEGYTPVDLTCVPEEPNGSDACDPNPCTVPNKTTCTDLNGTAICTCDHGYIDDGDGGCLLLPDPTLVSLLIYPTRPYLGYVLGTAMDWPDQGFSNQLYLTAVFSDGSTESPFDGPVVWSSDNEDAATVSETGLLISADVDTSTTVTIRAISGEVEAALPINIQDAELSFLSIISDNDNDLMHDGDYTIALDDSEQWRCLATDSQELQLWDLTRDMDWSSDDTDLVTVSNGETGGQLHRIGPGGVFIWCVIERGRYYVQTNVIAN